VSADPLGLTPGPNVYAYAPNVWRWLDPLGLARKCGGKLTEPTLPNKVIAEQGDVRIEHYYKSGDHGPAHAHVVGGGETTRIGGNGHPLRHDPPLTGAQQAVVDANRARIRSALRKIGRWLNYQDS
jgi:hypothetical protein